MMAKPSGYAFLAKRQRGNILFLILLAVVLFAALSYAVTGSLNGGAKDASNEKAATTAAQVINALSLQEPELMRFMERKNLKIHQVDFIGPYGTAYSSGNHTSNCTTNNCDFWHGSNGVTPPILPVEAVDLTLTGGNCGASGSYSLSDGRIKPYAMVISASGVGSDASDLVLMYHCIHPKICAEINIQEGLRQRQDAPIVGNGYGSNTVDFNTLSSSSSSAMPDTTPNRTAGSESRLMSRRLWCREISSPNGAELYAVIYAR